MRKRNNTYQVIYEAISEAEEAVTKSPLSTEMPADEATLKEVIRDISRITGREVTKEKEQKIIDTVLSNGVPKNIDQYLDDNFGN